MHIEKLSNIDDNMYSKLFEFDKSLVEKYGDSFSNEIWEAENFKYHLPGKEELSYVCFLENEMIGYIVSSIKNEFIYIHRFAVSKKGYSKLFFEVLLKLYANKAIFLMVNINNTIARNFYESFNFNVVDNNKTIEQFIANGLKIENSEIVIGENYRCYLMKRD